MSRPQYRRAHQKVRAKIKVEVDAGRAFCVEPICLLPDRWIPPGSKWHVSHDPTGKIVLGPSHATCNSTEGATRGAAMRAASQDAPANRWRI